MAKELKYNITKWIYEISSKTKEKPAKTITDICRKLDISRSTIYRYMKMEYNSKGSMSANLIKSFAEYFNTKLDERIGIEDMYGELPRLEQEAIKNIQKKLG